PIVMPSLIAMVLNSIGVPPASRTPRFTCSARRRRLKLHGIVSVHELAMPTIGRARSASPKPIAFRYDRAGARSRPSRRTRLRWRGSDGMGAHGNAARRGRPVSRESRRRPPAGAAWDRVSVAALALLVERLLAALAELPWFLAPLAFPS